MMSTDPGSQLTGRGFVGVVEERDIAVNMDGKGGWILARHGVAFWFDHVAFTRRISERGGHGMRTVAERPGRTLEIAARS